MCVGGRGRGGSWEVERVERRKKKLKKHVHIYNNTMPKVVFS